MRLFKINTNNVLTPVKEAKIAKEKSLQELTEKNMYWQIEHNSSLASVKNIAPKNTTIGKVPPVICLE